MLTTRFVALGLAIALLDASSAVAQSPAESLSGQLLDKTTGTPIPAGVIELTRTKRRVLTDSLGRFAFRDVPAGPHALAASALGYRQTITVATAGTPVVVFVTPEPVPLPAIVALSRARKGHVRGATLKVFGRAELLAAGDIPVAQFVNWKAHLFTQPCHTLPYFNESRPRGTWHYADTRPEMPMEWIGEECIRGLQGVFAPLRVMIDGEPIRYSSESWAHQTWDLGRVEVVYQYSTAAPYGGPFAVIRLYSLPYLARTAARISRLCEHITSADTLADRHLADLCAVGTSRP
jgi:hypothetical protein